MNPNKKPEKISTALARRLLPLAVILGLLLCLFMPSLYCLIEYGKMKEEAGSLARQFADKMKPLVSISPELWKYQATKYSYLINSFVPNTGISSIAIFDELAAPLTHYSHTNISDSIFGPREVKGQPAAIVFNNRKLGEVHIGISADMFVLTVVFAYLICLGVGFPLSLFVYRLPVRIVKKLERRLLGYQQTLEEKARLEEVSRQFQKTESLHRMAGAIAHHFNNQLSVVMGNLEIAIDGLHGSPEIGDNLTDALQGARKAAEVSGLMLTYLGQSTGKAARLDFGEICRRNLPLLKAAAPQTINFEISLPASGPLLLASDNQMRQVLTNLIGNAWEACGDKGTIRLKVTTVSASDIPAANRFPVEWQVQDTPHACMEVADTGCGIAEEDIDKLFDPFYSTKFTGRGLGLPVVLGIVRAHGGGVAVASTIGSGSSFQVFLPIAG